MKTSRLFAGLVVTMISGRVLAQGITVVGPDATAAGNELYEFFLDVTGAEGTFDTFELTLESDGLFNQIGEPAVGLIQSTSEDSGFSFLLYCPTCFGGQGLSKFGLDATTDTASLVQATMSSLGSNSASLQGNYFVAQAVLTGTGVGTYSAGFWDNGLQVGFDAGVFGVPEPSTAILVLSIWGALACGSYRQRTLLKTRWAATKKDVLIRP